jgi:nucleotide-binding universal stress UspA family protein
MKIENPESATGAAVASMARCDITQRAPGVVHLENILVPLDFSEMSLKSLRYAVSLAEQTGAKLTLLHVLKPPVCVSDFPYPGPGGQDGFDAIKKVIQEIRSTEIPAEVRVDALVRQCFVSDGILDVARQIHADLIVVTTRGETGLKHLLLGSTAESIVRLAPCSVLVVR